MRDWKIFYSSEAELDIASIFYELDREAEGQGRLFLKAIENLDETIGENPNKFDFVQDNIQQLILSDHPYKVIFEIFNDSILIMKVFKIDL